MNQFPATEAKVAYDHLTFRSTVEVLKAETPLEWDEFWVRVRSDKVMTRVAQAMLRAAALELCEPLSPDHKGEHSALAANNQSDALIVGKAAPPAVQTPATGEAETQETAGRLPSVNFKLKIVSGKSATHSQSAHRECNRLFTTSTNG